MRELLPTEKLVIREREWEGYILWKYIKHFYPHYTKLLIIKELRLKRILVNNTESFFQYKLALGDTVSISVLPERTEMEPKKPNYLKVSELEKFKSAQILFENGEIIIVYKLPGQVVQPDGTNSVISLTEILQQYSCGASNSSYKPKFVHRLDKPVAGLLIGAKNARAHNLLSEALKNKKLTKIYRALIVGDCKFNSKILTHWIDDRGIRVKLQEKASLHSKYSEAKVTKLRGFYSYSLVELQLITGRKNQLRSQLAYIGHPVLGDRKYYSESISKTLKNQISRFNSKRIALVSYSIGFPPYLVKELKLPWASFTLPEEKNIISTILQQR
ncbi:RluA family pseudouridine synthase [Candidatus Mycoplasma haematominutum]|uniref:RNA pseudouridylate synthase n=1 Tax=Candidatus Mycoplasma haematominutum 'Birmingham 1' TaxID=1116213 RepID=G8C2T7_9MOLU|nr:RluA family pseudouridine synthase [Candidatus Mycoplasma haematominutum]CCE66635.1 ribosomal large subunit pseudouridine synthase D [Candidatus Mycoplasma haematominutum 'Birmingham 1']